jgi:hypothetical protein
MSTTIYGDLGKSASKLESTCGITGSFVTPITGRRSSSLSSGLIGYYRFNNGSTVSAVDHAGFAPAVITGSNASIVDKYHTSGPISEFHPWAMTAPSLGKSLVLNTDPLNIPQIGQRESYLRIPNTTVQKVEISKKYTVSMWFKIDGQTVSNIFSNDGGPPPSLSSLRMGLYDFTGEHQLYWLKASSTDQHGSVYLRLDTIDDSGSAANDFIYRLSNHEQDGIKFKEDVWHHVVISLDTSNDRSDAHVSAWANGKKCNIIATRSNDGEHIQDLDSDASGFGVASHSNLTNSSEFAGELIECAIWNRILDPDEAETLYEMKYGFFEPKSGVMEAELPRLALRRLDNKTGSYPTTNREFYNDRHGDYGVSFNDSDTMVFTDGSTNYPRPYTLNKDISFAVGPDYKIIPAISLDRSFSNTDILTKSISYKSSDSLISWFSMPVTGTVLHGAICSPITGATVNTDDDNTSGHMFGNGIVSRNQVTPPSASFDVPFSSPVFENEKRLNVNNRCRPNIPRSISFSRENKNFIAAGPGDVWQSYLTGSKEMTFAAWIKPSGSQDSSEAYPTIFQIGDTSYIRLQIKHQHGNSKHGRVYFHAGRSNGSVDSYSDGLEKYRTSKPIEFDKWNHIAVTYDWKYGMVGSDNDIGVVTGSISSIFGSIPIKKRICNFYINGNPVDVNFVFDTSGNNDDHTEIPWFDTPCYIGADPDNSATKFYNGKIYEPAFWNKELTADEIKALFLSGFVKSSIVRYPGNIEATDAVRNRDIAYSSIQSFGNVTKGISDSRIEFTPGDDLQIFNDSRVAIRDSKFYKGSTREGFTSPLKSKTQIVIDLPSKEETDITRYSGVDKYYFDRAETAGDLTDFDGILLHDAQGPYYISSISGHGKFLEDDKTGFNYYNHEMSRWEQIGQIDPVSQNQLLHMQAVVNSGKQNIDAAYIRGGTQWFPSQFYPGNGNNFTPEYIDVNKNMGLPHFSNFAPNGTMYHATASQTLDIGSYINAPFLLEKVVLEVPVKVKRIYRDCDSISGWDGSAVSEPNIFANYRQQDNYVFFLYRQQDNTPGSKIDSKNNCKGTQRHLICSGVAAFYSSRNNGDGDGYAPLNTPSFSYDLQFNPLDANVQELSYTGSIKLEMTPAVANYRIHGKYNTRGIYDDGGSNSGLGTIADSSLSSAGKVYCAWPGGTTTKTLWGYADEKPAEADVPGASGYGDDGAYDWDDNDYETEFGKSVATLSRHFTGVLNWLELDALLDSSHADIITAGAFRGHPVYELPNVPDSVRMINDFGLQLKSTKQNMYITGTIPNTFSKFVHGNNQNGYYPLNTINPILGIVDADIGMVDPRVKYPRGGSDYGEPNDAGSFTTGSPTIESPYLLMPGDKIVFGIDAALDQNTNVTVYQSSLTGSMLTILSDTAGHGPCKITLYGSYVKLDREVTPTLNQHLTSDAVHEVVGNTSIFDQYDLYPLSQLSGSYTDLLMTGSFITEGGNVGSKFPIRSFTGHVDPCNVADAYRVNHSQGKGSKSDSYVYVNHMNGGAEAADPLHQYRKNILLEGNISRNVRLVDSSERYYDSMLPNLYEYARRNGGGKFKGIFNTGSADEYRMTVAAYKGYRDNNEDSGDLNLFLQGGTDFDDVITFARTGSLFFDHLERDSGGGGGLPWISGSEESLGIFRDSWVYDDQKPDGKTQDGWIYPRLTFPYDGNPARMQNETGFRIHLDVTSSLANDTNSNAMYKYNHEGTYLEKLDLNTKITAGSSAISYTTLLTTRTSGDTISFDDPDGTTVTFTYTTSWSTNTDYLFADPAGTYISITVLSTWGPSGADEQDERWNGIAVTYSPNVGDDFELNHFFNAYSKVNQPIFHFFGKYNTVKEMIWSTGWKYPDRDTYGLPTFLFDGTMTYDDPLSNSSNPNTYRKNYSYYYGAKGFKYGLKNYKPYRSTAVFKRDSYGQFRDMLEQRRNTSFYIETERFGEIIDSHYSPRGRITHPVQCKFVSASDGITRVGPASTMSSNLSIYATSSIPFTEGKSSNSYGITGWKLVTGIVGDYTYGQLNIDDLDHGLPLFD